MKYLKSVATLVVLVSILFSCNKNENQEISENNHDCVFVQNDDNRDGIIDDSERAIMNDCVANSLLSKSSIENTLVGEWELIGHGEGWIPTISKPCGYITITENELTFEFKNEFTDVTSTHLWEVEEVDWSGGQYFRLKVTPEHVEGLFINQFCENYMYGDATPSDGNMYLYRKME